MAVTTVYDDLVKTIEHGLTRGRDGTAVGLSIHPEYRVPVYVVNMCKSLLHVVKRAGATQCTLGDLVRLESTCTGVDYSHKLALRCQRLILEAAG